MPRFSRRGRVFAALLAADRPAAGRGFLLIDVLAGQAVTRAALLDLVGSGAQVFAQIERPPAEVSVPHRPGLAVIVGRTRMTMCASRAPNSPPTAGTPTYACSTAAAGGCSPPRAPSRPSRSNRSNHDARPQAGRPTVARTPTAPGCPTRTARPPQIVPDNQQGRPATTRRRSPSRQRSTHAPTTDRPQLRRSTPTTGAPPAAKSVGFRHAPDP